MTGVGLVITSMVVVIIILAAMYLFAVGELYKLKTVLTKNTAYIDAFLSEEQLNTLVMTVLTSSQSRNEELKRLKQEYVQNIKRVINHEG